MILTRRNPPETVSVQQYYDWRAVAFGAMTVEEYNRKYPHVPIKAR
jgi:hypothetical protein